MIQDPAQLGSPKVRASVDWREVWLEFCRQHGGSPMFHKGRLLFGDGWQYSASDYRGPAQPPPEDPVALRNLLLVYWKRRRAAARLEMAKVHGDLTDYRALAERYPEMGWLKVRRHDPEIGGWQPVDPHQYLESMEERTKLLEDDLKQTQERLEEIEHGIPKQPVEQ